VDAVGVAWVGGSADSTVGRTKGALEGGGLGRGELWRKWMVEMLVVVVVAVEIVWNGVACCLHAWAVGRVGAGGVVGGGGDRV
jgi:hypothetical protein